MNPKVSIIVPIYNQEKFLRDCLDSLINQTMQDIEIICFNDASTDNSLSILEEFAAKDQRIVVINSKINIKQGGGRNAGIKASKADYIMFVDSDDFVSYHFAEILYNEIVRTSADIVYCDYYESRINETIYHQNLGCDSSEDSEWLKHQITEFGGHLPTAIFRKRLFFENNLFFPENLFYEDNAIGGALVFAAKKIVKISEPLYYYRINPESTTRKRNDERFLHRLETEILLINNFKRLKLFDRYHSDIAVMFYRLYYRNTIMGIFESFDKIPYKTISGIIKTAKIHITADELSQQIKLEGFQNRMILKACNISPKLGGFLYRTRVKIFKLLNK